jgi:predicted  nucleic acid-binding Zn-ribbon protein
MGIDMNDIDSSRFKISFDENSPDTPIQDEIGDLRIDKLRQRINLLSFLIPALIGVIVLFGYFDIKNRFEKVYGSGTTDLQTLSKKMESQFSSLSIRQAKLESQLTKNDSKFEKSMVSLKIRLEKAEKTISKNITSSKTGNQKLETKIAGIDKTLAPFKADIRKLAAEIKAMETEIKTLQRKLKKDVSTLAGSFKQARKGLDKSDEINQIKSDISRLSSSKLNKNMFELAIKHEEKLYQQKLNILKKSFNDQLETMRKKMDLIEERQKKLSTKQSGAAKTTTVKPPSPQKEGIKL